MGTITFEHFVSLSKACCCHWQVSDSPEHYACNVCCQCETAYRVLELGTQLVSLKCGAPWQCLGFAGNDSPSLYSQLQSNKGRCWTCWWPICSYASLFWRDGSRESLPANRGTEGLDFSTGGEALEVANGPVNTYVSETPWSRRGPKSYPGYGLHYPARHERVENWEIW